MRIVPLPHLENGDRYIPSTKVTFRLPGSNRQGAFKVSLIGVRVLLEGRGEGNPPLSVLPSLINYLNNLPFTPLSAQKHKIVQSWIAKGGFKKKILEI